MESLVEEWRGDLDGIDRSRRFAKRSFPLSHLEPVFGGSVPMAEFTLKEFRDGVPPSPSSARAGIPRCSRSSSRCEEDACVGNLALRLLPLADWSIDSRRDI